MLFLGGIETFRDPKMFSKTFLMSAPAFRLEIVHLLHQIGLNATPNLSCRKNLLASL